MVKKTEIPAAELVPGDILLLEAGDVAAADGRILENHSLQVNESALTGESEPVNKTDEVLLKDDLPLGRSFEYGLQRLAGFLRPRRCLSYCNRYADRNR